MFKSLVAACVAAIYLSPSAMALVPQQHEARAASKICSNGIYGELSLLARYPPAIAYCSQKHPVNCTSTKVKRLVSSTPSTISSKPTSAVPKATTASVDAYSSAYTKCLKQPVSIISTLCSCIQTPKACPTTKSTTQTTAKSSTRSTTVSRTISSATATPTACSPAQSKFCTSQTQLLCFCQLDVDGVTPVCSNGAACPQTSYPNPPPPCASDADCVLFFPGSVYNRCVYSDQPNFCTPTYCATEDGCNQQRSAGA